MGNIGSQTCQVSQKKTKDEEPWTHSFPRTQFKYTSFKVLPERTPYQQLKPTSNGMIIQSGGTLSKNQHLNRLSLKRKVKRVTSEPSIHAVLEDEICNQKEEKINKKYKAPPPPKYLLPSKSSGSEKNRNNENSLPKARLFKTKAESKKIYSNNINSTEYATEKHKSQESQEYLDRCTSRFSRNNRLSLPAIKLNENADFKEELEEATKRIRNFNEANKSPVHTFSRNNPNEKLKTLDIDIGREQELLLKRDLTKMDENGNHRKRPSSFSELNQHTDHRTFYFGMNENSDHSACTDPLVDHFASNINKGPVHTSDSDISNDEIDEAQQSLADIDLQLRPILPKKQLEIPRFSPATAWKLLSVSDGSKSNDFFRDNEDPGLFSTEDRIERNYRPPPPIVKVGTRSNNDRSGDSGISGDAGPTGFDESPDPILNHEVKLEDGPLRLQKFELPWTPKQDLDGESSAEEGNEDISTDLRRPMNKPHIFSLSLPRDNQLASYLDDSLKISFLGLKNLKHSGNGELLKKDFSNNTLESDNWFLSKSAPNSLNVGLNYLHAKRNQEQDKYNAGRIIYLPELNAEVQKEPLYSKSCTNQSLSPSPIQLRQNHENSELLWRIGKKSRRFTFQSTIRQIERRRLAEKLTREVERREKQRLREMEAMQKVEEEFQRKRAREKANIKQQLRLCSLRDKDLFQLSAHAKSHLSIRSEPDGAVSSSTSSLSYPNLEGDKKMDKTEFRIPKNYTRNTNECKGKIATTQVLSEYHQPQREYKEYRSSSRYVDEFHEDGYQTTVHPKVTCKVPKVKKVKVTQVSNSTNYRKNFAYGLTNTRAGDTNSEDSQIRTSPCTYGSSYNHITRL